MPITIKDAVKIAYDEAMSNRLKIIPDCGEGPFGWSFSFATEDLMPIPGGFSFRVAPDGKTEYFSDGRPSNIPPSGPAPGVRSVNIKTILAELGEPYISLREAVRIAHDKIESLPKGDPLPLSFTFIPECWDKNGTRWRFFVMESRDPEAFVSLWVTCYGDVSGKWCDLPLPNIAEYEDSGWSKVDISEYLKD